MPTMPEPPPTVRDLRAACALAEQAVSHLLALVITAPPSLAESVGDGVLVASLAEARRDIRTAMSRLADEADL
jgi:hypothetical protein